MKKEVFFFILGILAFANAGDSGDSIDWDDAPYMVKVRCW